MKVKDILKICNGKLLCGNDDIEITTFSKDTRTINKGETYVAIKGDVFDGNNYVENAFEKGAYVAIIDKQDFDISNYNNRTIVLVKDTIEALCDLAKHVRDNFNGPVIAVTGSVGKTTTKDLIGSVLEKKYKVFKNEGSYNNKIGLPFCIVNSRESDIWITELGMNSFGEISYLSKLVRPNISVITNIGTAHIGLLGSRENILKAKLEILEGMENGSKLLINNDNDLLHNYYLENKKDIITVGINNSSDYKAQIVRNNIISVNDEECEFYSIEEPLVINALLAFALGKMYDVSIEDIKDAIKNFKQEGNRLKEEKTKSGFILINDSFNANYDSVKLAIEYLSKYKQRKIMILGDMLELGEYSKDTHNEIGRILAEKKIDVIITIGEETKYTDEGAIQSGFNGIIKHFNNNEDCLDFLKSFVEKNDVVLAKASKKMDFVNLCKNINEI